MNTKIFKTGPFESRPWELESDCPAQFQAMKVILDHTYDALGKSNVLRLPIEKPKEVCDYCHEREVYRGISPSRDENDSIYFCKGCYDLYRDGVIDV